MLISHTAAKKFRVSVLGIGYLGKEKSERKTFISTRVSYQIIKYYSDYSMVSINNLRDSGSSRNKVFRNRAEEFTEK